MDEIVSMKRNDLGDLMRAGLSSPEYQDKEVTGRNRIEVWLPKVFS